MSKSATSTRHLDLLPAIEQGKRDSFRELLAELLHCKPTQSAVRKAANKNPASYFKSLKTVSELAGYHSHSTEITNNILLQVNGMSDSALMMELERIQATIDSKAIDHQPEDKSLVEPLSQALVPIYT